MENKPALLDGYISIAITAEELGVHVRTLKRWKARRYGPPSISVGQRIYYRRAEITAWLASLGAPVAKKSCRSNALGTAQHHAIEAEGAHS